MKHMKWMRGCALALAAAGIAFLGVSQSAAQSLTPLGTLEVAKANTIFDVAETMAPLRAILFGASASGAGAAGSAATGPVVTREGQGFVYRHYSATGHYLAASATRVYGLGPATAGVLKDLGALEELHCSLQGQSWVAGLGACMYPMGVKVVGANRLPETCLTQSNPCWREAMRNGTVKFIETSALMTGVPNGNDIRPVAFAYFLSGNGNWNTLPIYRDDGTLVGSDISGGVSAEIDWVYGTSKGLIMHQQKDDKCYEKKWYPPNPDPTQGSNVWSTGGIQVTCP